MTGHPVGDGRLIRYAARIQAEFLVPEDLSVTGRRFEFGARSEAAEYVGALLAEEVPALHTGDLHVTAIARRPGVLTKVGVRARVVGLKVSGDEIARVRERLDGERIDVVAWHHSAPTFIASALGLRDGAPMLLLPAISHARVLLGEIDVRGIAGWRGLNVMLASAITGWRIRLEPVAATDAWRHLSSAMKARRAVRATVIGPSERGIRLDVLGLFAILSATEQPLEPGEDLPVRVTRMDADEGRIFVSDRLAPTGQLPLL